jgi:hypothetical protein
LQIRSKFSRFGPLAVIAWLLSSCLDFNAMAQEVPPAYIEPGYALRFYPGDEDTRLGASRERKLWPGRAALPPSRRSDPPERLSLDPVDPTIANNIAVMDAGLAYFHGFGP